MPAAKGLPRPPPMVWFFLGLAFVSSLSVAWGGYAMRTVGETHANGLAIGIGGPIAILSIGMLFLTVNGWRLARALSRGENEIARWTVSPDDFIAFAASDAARNALGPEYRNVWKPPKKVPAEGLEVAFGRDIVMVGNRFFGLVNTGMFTFEGVQILPGNPLAIEFGMVSTTLAGGSAPRVDVGKGLLRIPIGRLARADAVRVLDHYKRVDSHEIVVNPDFYRGRMRFGLVAAPLCFLAAAAGFGMQSYGINANGELNLILMIAGLLCGIGALVLAGTARYLSWEQHRRR